MAHFDTQLAALNLTFPQALLLHHLDDAMPMNAAAGRCGCDPSNMTGIVDRLEGRGLIERQQIGGDRRVKYLVLTPEGERLKGRVDAVLREVPGLSDLSAGDQVVLRDLLARSLGRS